MTKPNLSKRAGLVPIGLYLGTGLMSLVISAWVLKVWRADFSIPFYGDKGDAPFVVMIVKNLTENGRYNINPFLGAPGQSDLRDFPLAHTIHFLFLRLLSLLSSDFAVVLNSYFLLTFPLIAMVSLFVFRRYRISYPSAIVGSLLFAFLPYHFHRQQAHLFFGSYYLVPLMVLVALWLGTKEPLFCFKHVTAKALISLASCALIASDNPYFAFFGAYFLIIAGATGFLRYGETHTLRSTAICLATLAVAFILNLAPNLLYFQRSGRNPRVAERDPGQAERYGMKIAQLVLPVDGHRVPVLREIKDRYNSSAPLNNENTSASLGLIASGGFLLLIGWLMFGPSVDGRIADLLRRLSILNLSGLLFATVGGFGSVFALLVHPQIRSQNRMSVWIGFFAIFAVVLSLEKLSQISVREVAVGWRRRVLYFLVLGLVLGFGVFDETSRDFVPKYSELKAESTSDAEFFRRVEASLPQTAMIFQLPYIPFPENGPVNRMNDYDHVRGYLHSRQLRWSYGAMRGREWDLWQKSIVAKPVDKMVETLVFAGFNGIYVDRFGYTDQAMKLEAELTKFLDSAPVVSTNQRLSFFDFSRLSAKLRARYSAQEWQWKQDAVLHSLRLEWGAGFYPTGEAEAPWGHWASSPAEIHVNNPSKSEKRFALEMVVSTGHREPSHVRIDSTWFSQDLAVDAAGRSISISGTVRPGRDLIVMSSDAKRFGGSAGLMRTVAEKLRLSKVRVLRVSNFELRELEADLDDATNTTSGTSEMPLTQKSQMSH